MVNSMRRASNRRYTRAVTNGRSQFSRVVTIPGGETQLWTLHRGVDTLLCKVWELTPEQFAAIADYSGEQSRPAFMDRPDRSAEFSDVRSARDFFARASGKDLTSQAIDFFERIDSDS